MFQVIRQVETLVGSKIKKSGLLIDKNFPILGASADGLGEDFVLEVKCPTTHSTFLNYVDNGVVKPKVYLY